MIECKTFWPFIRLNRDSFLRGGVKMEEEQEKKILSYYEIFSESIFKYILMMVQDYVQAEDKGDLTHINRYL